MSCETNDNSSRGESREGWVNGEHHPRHVAAGRVEHFGAIDGGRVALLMGYFRSVPHELEDAARMDGATRLQTMFKVFLPVCTPGFISAGIFAFTLAQNKFLYALIFLTQTGVRTVPVGGIAELVKGDVFYWEQLMAAAPLGFVPVAIICSFFVEHYVAGPTAGAARQ
jgi:multiple sugar transport system permease protein